MISLLFSFHIQNSVYLFMPNNYQRDSSRAKVQKIQESLF